MRGILFMKKSLKQTSSSPSIRIISSFRGWKLLLSAFMIGSLNFMGARAQKVFDTHSESRADIRVFVVNTESRADLIVSTTNTSSRARKEDNRGIWYMEHVESRADKKICFVNTESRADLKVFFTNTESRAGWRKHEKKSLFQ